MVCYPGMIYQEDNRGKVQFRNRMKQIIEFDGIKYGNITPTDIDGFFEKENEGFVFYEFKLDGCDMPTGQSLAYKRVVDALQTADKKSILFLCKHNVQNPMEPVPAKDAIVEKLYFRGHWFQGDGQTAKEWTDRFMGWLEIEMAKRV